MTTFTTSRHLPATAEQVFAAIAEPERLARWWGPAGFTNTFSVCEFQEGGRWVFVMHGPDGGEYPNESVFAEIDPSRKVVIDHVCQPVFRLSILLVPSAGGTTVHWAQAFEDDMVAKQLEHICIPANEQNLDRLAKEVREYLSTAS